MTSKCFQKIFTIAPEVRHAFGIPDSVCDVRYYPPFHRSGRLFISVIDLCIRNIFSLEAEMGPVLVMYGRRHYHRQNQGFRASYLPLFAQCIVGYINEYIDKDSSFEKVLKSWRCLMAYITGKLAEGVELERLRAHSLRRKSAL
ncbi:hypothetical protein AB6A40_011491 [Gnathostoma spinigerum]|uniref:Globin domain-containing protein n=1 Tax=Gnathostoma spinigerum TaxID=75299 RepID=A0ABD6F449_9BILA